MTRTVPASWDPHERLLTIEEAAASSGRPKGTLYRWVSEGHLTPVAKFGRLLLYLEADVLACDAKMRGFR